MNLLKKWPGAAIILLLLVPFWQACSNHKNEADNAPKGSIHDKFVYKKAKVELISAEEDLQFNGEVTFDQNNVVRVFPIVSGNVEKVNVELGSYVQKGQVLAVIRSNDINNYINDYTVAKTNADLQKKNLEVAENLYQSKSASELDVITARKDYANAKTELQRLEQLLQLYGSSPSAGNTPQFVVKSPISGYVVEKNITVNTLIRPDNGANIFTISDLKKVWVLAQVFENDISAVKMGEEVSIYTLAYPDREFKGKIGNIGNVLDKESRILYVRIELDNSEGILKPDMFAIIKLHTILPGGKLMAVKPRSVIFDRDKYYVVVVNPNDKFYVREVDIVKNTSRFAYISKGISPADEVVTEGSLLIYNELKD